MTLDKHRSLATENDHEIAWPITDSMWGIVIGIGAVLAFVAFVLRWTISESPRYALDVDSNKQRSDQQHVEKFSYEAIKEYSWTQGSWRYLAGTSICWVLFETAYSGLGINDPRTMAQIWDPPLLENSKSYLPGWIDLSRPNGSIYEATQQDAIRSMLTVATGSVLGSIMLIMSIEYMSRKMMQVWSFVRLAALFGITGCLFNTSYKAFQALEIPLYTLYPILFNLGQSFSYPACIRTDFDTIQDRTH